MRFGVAILLAGMAALIVASVFLVRPITPAVLPSPAPATAPSTRPASTGSQQAQPIRTLLDLLRRENPGYPTTRPLDTPLDIPESANILLRDPVYLCLRGDLWITHPEARPAQQVLPEAGLRQLHLVQEQVLFAHWIGPREVNLVIASGDGGALLISSTGACPLPKRSYLWKQALSQGEQLAVPSESGASVFVRGEEHFQPMAGAPQILLDGRGVLAWVPMSRAYRFAEGRWRELGSEPVLHMVPLSDGSLSWIVAGTEDTVELRRSNLAGEALRTDVAPSLGGMIPINNRLRLNCQLPDGGAIFHAPDGVTVVGQQGNAILNPVWISVRPGRPVELLDDRLGMELEAGLAVYAFGAEWIVADPELGMHRFVGGQFTALLKPAYRRFDQPLGIDRVGRWLFRCGGEYLLVDPTLPDVEARLPVWTLKVAGQVGWDKENWPAMQRQAGFWKLEAGGWRPLDVTKNELMAAPAPTPPSAPLCSDARGRSYYAGPEGLRVLYPDGREMVVALPAVMGAGGLHVAVTGDDVLFVLPQPGKLLRYRVLADSAPQLEATFTHRIPTVPITRMWVDPAGRLVLAWPEHLTICFPQGRIPQAIRALMPAGDLATAESGGKVEKKEPRRRGWDLRGKEGRNTSRT